jgi:hypothetical protein
MADPFSAVASAITLVAACTAISKRTVTFIRSLHEAPEELLRLSNEITDLTTVLHQIEKGHGQGSTTPTYPTYVGLLHGSAHITQAKLLILELDRFLNSLKKVCSPQGRIEIDRLGWARKRKVALSLERKLAGTKQVIQLHLATGTS